MKTKSLFFIILFAVYFFKCDSINAKINPALYPDNDSLLFDGAELNNSKLNTADGPCYAKVTYLKGSARGKRVKSTFIQTCVLGGTYITEELEGDLEENNILVMNDEVSLGDNSSMEIQYSDNSIMRFGPNSKFKLECSQFTADQDKLSYKLSAKFILGTIWGKVTHTLGGDQSTEVSNKEGHAGAPRGTIYCMEFKEENGEKVTIVKTIEGHVEASNNPGYGINEEEIRTKSEELKNKFNSGMITLEEYTAKLKELVDPVKNILAEYNVLVEAGYQSVIRGKLPPSKPEKFIEDSGDWYLDKNFYKK